MKVVWRVSVIVLVAGMLGFWCWLRWVEHSLDRPFHQIEEGLYLGSAVNEPPPGTQAVVNVCGREDPYPIEASHWDPVFENGKEPNLAWLRRAVMFIAEQRCAGRATYVHCLAGMNRSGAVMTAYLMYEHGWSRDEALAFVQSKRDVVQPNPTLMRLLADWEAELCAAGR